MEIYETLSQNIYVHILTITTFVTLGKVKIYDFFDTQLFHSLNENEMHTWHVLLYCVSNKWLVNKRPREESFHQSLRLARASQTVFPQDKRKFLRASILNPTKLSTFQEF